VGKAWLVATTFTGGYDALSRSPNTVISTLKTATSSTTKPKSGSSSIAAGMNLSRHQPSICTPLASNTRTPELAKTSSTPPRTWLHTASLYDARALRVDFDAK
jgi:hypothetical protein